MSSNRAVLSTQATAQAISRALNLPIDLARKSLLTFVTLVGASAFRLTYCVHRLGVGYFLASSEEMMEADGDEILLYSIESTIGTEEVSVFGEETKAAKACLEQAQREGVLFACDHFGIRPCVHRVREVHSSKKRILVRLGKPPGSSNQGNDTGALKPATITELEEEEENDSAMPLRPPEPETSNVPPPCDISEVSELDDIMCRAAPQKRKADISEEKTPTKRVYTEMVDLTKGIALPKRGAFAGKGNKGGRQVTLGAWLK